MSGPPDPNIDRQLTPFERIESAKNQLESLAHGQSLQPHHPHEQIYFQSRLRNGQRADAFVDYEYPRGVEKICLQLVFPERPVDTESYMIDPHDWSGRRAEATLPGEQLDGPVAAERMAERFDEILRPAADNELKFVVIKNEADKV